MLKSKNKNNNYIKRLYYHFFLSNMYFDRALWMIFLLYKGLSIYQIVTLEIILHLTTSLFEIPTGIIADKINQKRSILISRILIILYALTMICFNDFKLLMIPFILLGLATAFESGSDTAMIYQLSADKSKNSLVRKYGIHGFTVTIALAIAMVIAPFLIKYTWDLMYILLAIMELLAILVLTSIRYKEKPKKIVFKNEQNYLKQAVKLLKAKNNFTIVVSLVLFTGAINALYLFFPIFLEKKGITIFEISFIFVIESVITAICYYLADRLEKKYNINRLILILPIIAMIFVFTTLFVNDLALLIAFLIIEVVTTIFYPLQSTIIIKLCGDNEDIQSTFLSLTSLINSIIMGVLFVIMGFIASNINIDYTFIIIVVALLIAILIIKLKTAKLQKYLA